MAKANQLVLFRPDKGEWVVRSSASKATPKTSYPTKLAAVIAARAKARKGGGSLIIHFKDGRIQEIDSYENIPHIGNMAAVAK